MAKNIGEMNGLQHAIERQVGMALRSQVVRSIDPGNRQSIGVPSWQNYRIVENEPVAGHPLSYRFSGRCWLSIPKKKMWLLFRVDLNIENVLDEAVERISGFAIVEGGCRARGPDRYEINWKPRNSSRFLANVLRPPT